MNNAWLRTTGKVAYLGAAAMLLVPITGFAANDFGESDPILLAQETSSVEIKAPVIHTGDGDQNIAGRDVNITYKTSGISQEQFNQLTEELNVSRAAAVRFLKTLDEKDVALEERGAQFEVLLKKYKELEKRLAKRGDEISIKAKELLAEGKLDEAEALLKESLAARLKDLEKQRELAAADAFELGGIQELKLDYTGAREYYRQAVELATHNSTYLNDLGVIELRLGQYKKAIDLFEKAISINREVYGEKPPKVATGLNNLGSAWDALGEHQKAIDLYEQALSIDREIYGEKHPSVAIDLNNLGRALYSLGEYQKAIGLFEQALAIDRVVYGEKHTKVAIRLNNLGLVWDALGDYQKAIGLYGQALAIDRAVYGEEHPEVAINLNNLGSAWYALGEHQKAIGLFEQALAIDRVVYGERHPKVAIRLNNLGMALKALGKSQKAIGLYEQALAIFIEVLGPDHPSVQTIADNLQQAQETAGE